MALRNQCQIQGSTNIVGTSDQACFCSRCLTNILPFQNLNNNELKQVFNLTSDKIYNTLQKILKSHPSRKSNLSCNYCDIYDLKSHHLNKGLSVLHINIRSLIKNMAKLEEMLLESSVDPDIIAISETWLTNSKTTNIHLPGYNFFFSNSTKGNVNNKYSAGGVGVFVKKSLNVSEYDHTNMHCKDAEDIWLSVSLGNKQIIVGVIYRHPHSNIVEFQEKICKILDDFNTNNKVYYICGDINIDLLKYDSLPKVKTYIESLHCAGCLPVVNRPTRVTTKTATLIDHVYTNDLINEVNCYILNYEISDHLPLYFHSTAGNKASNKLHTKMQIRDTKNFNVENFLVNLQQSLNKMLKSSNYEYDMNIHQQFTVFIDTFKNSLNKHAPLRSLTRKEIKLKKKPWITPALLKSFKTKNKLYSLMLRNPLDETISNKYKIYKNKLTHVKELAKKKHYNNLIEENINDSKKTWRTINEIIRRTQRKQTHIPSEITDESGNSYTDPIAISNVFNNYFARVGPTLASKIPPPSCIKKQKIHSAVNSFFLQPITEVEVISLLRELNSSKSTGSNEIPIKYLKLATTIIAPILTDLFNYCIKSGEYPDILKVAQIVPIHKKGEKEKCTNYRPISLLSPINKIFEKFIYNQLQSYLDKKQLIHPNQYGFRPGYSTSLAVSTIYDEIINNMEEKKYTCAIFLDLAKAFDTVDHNILIQKLDLYGIRGNVLDLFKSYFCNRKHYTVVNGIPSTLENASCGVPQGSTLGPLLFLLYMNDLPTVTKFKVNFFADDTNLIMSDFDAKQLENDVNNELKNVDNWMRRNKLSINFAKTEYMLISNKKNIDSFKINIDSYEIERKDHIRYLGVLLDNKLTWHYQVEKVRLKVVSGVWALARLRNFVSAKILLNVYYSMICSHINYCILSWGSAARTVLKPIYVLQKKAVRLITRSDYKAHANPIFKKLNILTIYDIHKLEVAKYMYKVSKQSAIGRNAPFNLLSSLHSHSTRSSTNLNYFIPRAKTETGKKSKQILGARIWSEVPSVIKGYSFSNFVKKYKQHLLSEYD